jgi:CBS domain-containing protein
MIGVEEFMTKNPVAVDVDQSVGDVARLMRDKNVGSVVVLRGGKVAGIATDRALLLETVAENRSAADTRVGDVMTPAPAKLTLEDNIFSAIDTMRSAGVVRRVPVVNAENELLGVVSISDIALIAKDLVDAVMLEETHHAMEEAHILTGAKRMVRKIRRPTRLERMPAEQEVRPLTSPTPPGPPGRGGGAGRAPRGSAVRDAPTTRPEARGSSSPSRPSRRSSARVPRRRE